MDEHSYDEVVTLRVRLSPAARADLDAIAAHVGADAATAVRILCELGGHAVRARVHGREVRPDVLAALADPPRIRQDEGDDLQVEVGWVQAGGIAQVERVTEVRRDVALAAMARVVAAAVEGMPPGHVEARYRIAGSRHDEAVETWSQLGAVEVGSTAVRLQRDPVSPRAVGRMVVGTTGAVLVAMGLGATVIGAVAGDVAFAGGGFAAAAVGTVLSLPLVRGRGR